MNRVIAASIVGLLLAVGLPGTAAWADTDEPAGDIYGSWSEDEGNSTLIETPPESPSEAGISTFWTKFEHKGKAERKSIRGTTHKRSVGRTVWPGRWHYTTARLEHTWPHKGVITTSGQKWDRNATVAKTRWVAYNPKKRSSGFGRAKTYYGR